MQDEIIQNGRLELQHFLTNWFLLSVGLSHLIKLRFNSNINLLDSSPSILKPSQAT